MDKLTPQLNDQQIRQNIDVMQKQGVPNDKVQAYVNNYSKSPTGTYVLKQPQATPAPQGSSFNVSDLANPGNIIGRPVGDAIANAAKGGLSQIATGFKQTLNTANAPSDPAAKGNLGKSAMNALGDTGQMARGALNEAAGGINTLFSPITGALQAGSKLPGVSQTLDTLKKYITDPSANAISNNKALQEFMTKYPNADEVAGNLITIGASLLGGKEAPEVKSAFGDAASAVKGKISEALPSSEPTISVGGQALKLNDIHGETGANLMKTLSPEDQKALSNFDQHYSMIKQVEDMKAKGEDISDFKDEYQKRLNSQPEIPQGSNAKINIPKSIPEKIGGAADAVKGKLQEKYVNDLANKYREVAGSTKRTGKILAKSELRGKDPAQYLAERGIKPTIENGTMLTTDQADKLHASVDPLNEHLNIALDEVQPGIEKAKLEDVRRQALANTDRLPNLSEIARKQIKNSVNEEFDLQKEKYGDTVTLRQLNDIKRANWADTKFDSTKPYKNESTYNIGRAAKDTIEKNVPKDAVDIKQLNSEIGNAYDAEKFLRSLDLGKVKGGRLGRYFGRITGAAIGKALPIPGGEIVGVFGGDAVVKILQDSTFSNPLKARILRNLEVKDPAAYTQAIKFVKNTKLIREARLKLPAPRFMEGKEFKGGDGSPRMDAEALNKSE